VLRTVAEFMAKAVVTASPQETVAAVARRITSAGVGGAPIVDGDRVVGLVTLEDLVGQPPYRPIREVMTVDIVTAPPTARITDASALMDQHHVGRLPIVQDGALVGIVTRGDLLKELGRLTDPLTDLPWSGTLRQQAADLLKAGREISVVFMDLDDFGLANKLFLALDGAPPDAPPDSHFVGALDRVTTGSYQLRPHGWPMIAGFFGGALALDLERAGPAAMEDFAAGELAGLFGSALRRRLRRLASSAWASDPFARGSYSFALPDHAGDRAELAAPLDGRLFFAGEACSGNQFSTAHGALLSGRAAADDIAAFVMR